MKPGDDYRETGHFTIEIDGESLLVPRFCPHRAGRLEHGHVNATRATISCPLHHSLFCLRTGEQLSGPVCGRLDLRRPSNDDRKGADASAPTSIQADTRNPETHMRYAAEQVWTPLSESVMDWDDAFHALMLNDKPRMDAYQRAIREVVKPGDLVVDLGTGTGILSLWALEAGASRVIGIEMNGEILLHAVRRMAEADFADRFVPINQLSYDIELDAPADVLISEIIGNLADNENFQPILQDAIERFLKPGGHCLPLGVASHLVPVAAPRAHDDVSAGRIHSLGAQYDIEQLYRQRGIDSPFDLYYDCILPESLYLATPLPLQAYAGKWDQPSAYTRTLRFPLHSDGTLTGFKGYFVAQLSETTTLDISSGDIDAGLTSDSWKHAFLPIASPIDVRRGDVLTMTFTRHAPTSDSSGFQQVYLWRGQVLRDGEAVGAFSQCTGACPAEDAMPIEENASRRDAVAPSA